MKPRSRSLTTALKVLLLPAALSAQVPEMISVQGRLTDSLGVPIDTTLKVDLTLYQDNVDVFTQGFNSVEVNDGVFNVTMGGASAPLNAIQFDRPSELGVQINNEPEMSPRIALVAAPFALGVRGFSAVAAEDASFTGMNIIAGDTINTISPGVVGGTISGGGGFVPGLSPNSVEDDFATIGGGRGNTASGFASVIGGGAANIASGLGTSIGGGVTTSAIGSYATTAGGRINHAIGYAASVTGGEGNEATGAWSAVGGGVLNDADGNRSFVGGGSDNLAGDSISVVAGGLQNDASGIGSFIGSGKFNEASGSLSVVSGGVNNKATGSKSVIGGGEANIAGGFWASVPGGFRNAAWTNGTLAAGTNARALHQGSFVWSDNTGFAEEDSFSTTGVNQFLINASGGIGVRTNSPIASLTIAGPDTAKFGPDIALVADTPNQANGGQIRMIENPVALAGAYVRYDGVNNLLILGQHTTGETDVAFVREDGFGIFEPPGIYPFIVGNDTTNGNGAHVTDGGMWTNGSSRTFKEGFEPVDPQEILMKLIELPIGRWHYKGDDGSSHLGPTAEDFHEAFGLGSDQRYIGTGDADGVAMAALKALYDIVAQQQAQIEALREMLSSTSH